MPDVVTKEMFLIIYVSVDVIKAMKMSAINSLGIIT